LLYFGKQALKNKLSNTRKIRYFIFLKEVFLMATTCFGGPQVHLTIFIKRFVNYRRYLTEPELIELQALCQLIPGPTSTQTLTAIGFRLGGASLSYLTLLVWIFPSFIIMTAAALGVAYLDSEVLISTTRFIKPMGVAFVFYAAYAIGRKVIDSKISVALFILATIVAYFFRSPYVTPIWIVLGGVATALNYRKQERMPKSPIKIQWANFILWAAFFLFIVALGAYTKSLPIRLFENFYRNGSLAFGGGHILKPLLYNEFVEFKHYLSRDEYLSGIAIAELVPGPTFSISGFIGSLSMRPWGIKGEILGSIVSTIGIFLPGTFLIFFVIRFWDQLKKYRGIRASLAGINAASTGLTLAAGISLFEPMAVEPYSVMTALLTFMLLITERVPSYLIILSGLLLGILFTYI
jgi:chromate transporter